MTAQTQCQHSQVLLTTTNVYQVLSGGKSFRITQNLTGSIKHSVHALMGENGAGKSTLLKCLIPGMYAKDEGEILFLGEPVKFKTSKKALENGISMVKQRTQIPHAPN